MMVYTGLQFFLSAIPKLGQCFEVKVTYLEFHTNVKVFAYILQTLIDFFGICYGDSYRSKILFSMILHHCLTFEVNVIGFT